MRVRATATGFINGSIVEAGDEFDVPEKLFSKKWMEKVEKTKPEKAEKQPAQPADGAI